MLQGRYAALLKRVRGKMTCSAQSVFWRFSFVAYYSSALKKRKNFPFFFFLIFILHIGRYYLYNERTYLGYLLAVFFLHLFIKIIFWFIAFQ